MSKGKKILMVLALGGAAWWLLNRKAGSSQGQPTAQQIVLNPAQQKVVDAAKTTVKKAGEAVTKAGTINSATQAQIQRLIDLSNDTIGPTNRYGLRRPEFVVQFNKRYEFTRGQINGIGNDLTGKKP